MLEKIPSPQELTALLGEDLYAVWENLRRAIEEKYEMELLWDKGYSHWVYELKYRRGGKTLCTLNADDHDLGVQIIFGKDERARVEAIADELSAVVRETYENAHTFHDGKWVMFHPADASMTPDLIRLLGLKRRPNRK